MAIWGMGRGGYGESMVLIWRHVARVWFTGGEDSGEESGKYEVDEKGYEEETDLSLRLQKSLN